MEITLLDGPGAVKASRPTSDASTLITNSLVGSGIFNTGAVVKRFFKFSKAERALVVKIICPF